MHIVFVLKKIAIWEKDEPNTEVLDIFEYEQDAEKALADYALNDRGYGFYIEQYEVRNKPR